MGFSSLSEEDAKNCMLCIAPSKSFNLAGLQTAFTIIPDNERRNQYIKAQLNTTANPKCNILGYEASRIAYNQCGEWLDCAIQIIQNNKQMVSVFFAKEFPQIQIMDFEATYLLWMDFNGLGIDYKELERINKEEAYLFFDEGHVFGSQGEGFERWNLACPTRYIEAALGRMKRAYSPYLKS